MSSRVITVAASRDNAATFRPVPLTLVPGETKEIELELVPAVAAHVRVRDAGGADVPCDIALAVSLPHGDSRRCPVSRSSRCGEAWLGPLKESLGGVLQDYT